MIFDEDIVEERFETRDLPSMVPSYHYKKRFKGQKHNKEYDIENQALTFSKHLISSDYKGESCNVYEQKTTEMYNTNPTDNEEIMPFANMNLYQIKPGFNSQNQKFNDNIDLKQVELQNKKEKYAQGVRSMKVNQNILQSINLAQSQTFYNCNHCHFKHQNDSPNEKQFQQRDSDNFIINSKKGSYRNSEKLLDKLRICCSSQENQGPLYHFQLKGSFNIQQFNSSLGCQCSCHYNPYNSSPNNNQFIFHNQSSGSASGSRIRRFHSSIIDSSQFGHHSPTHARDDLSYHTTHRKLNNLHPYDFHNQLARIQQGRSKSTQEMADNPEIRKKWAVTKIIQMSFDVQLTHTLIESEQILDQMIDKLLEFKKYRQQQRLEGSLIQPQLSHGDFLKYQQSLKTQKTTSNQEQFNGSPNNVNKASQFINNNFQHNNDDMSLSLSKVQDYIKSSQFLQFNNKNITSSSPNQDGIQMSSVLVKQSNGLEGIKFVTSPTKRRNSFLPPVQRPTSKYNFSSIKLTGNQTHLTVDRSKIRKRSRILQEKFKQKTKQGVCSVCIEEQVLIQISNNCNHYFCSFCITNYFEDKIAKCDVLEINCLNFQCTNKYSEAEVKEIVDSNTFQQYLKFKRLIMIRQDQTLRWCTVLDCTGVLKGSTLNPKMQCPICQTQQCFICSGAWHEGIRCDQAINDEYQKEQLELRKNCPKCLKEVKKSKKCLNKSTCKQCGHRFCWLCNRKVTPFHFSTWNFFGCPGQININQIPSYYQKVKYKLKALLEYISQIIMFIILILLYPIFMLLVSFFLPLLIVFNKNGGTVKYKGTKKFFVVTGLIILGIILYPLWYLISIVPGSCWFYKKLRSYLQNHKDIQKSQESEEEIEEDYDILSQQISKGNNLSLSKHI